MLACSVLCVFYLDRIQEGHFTDKETTAKRMKRTCPWPLSYSVAQSNESPGLPSPEPEPSSTLGTPPGVYSEYYEPEVPPFSTAEKRFVERGDEKASVQVARVWSSSQGLAAADPSETLQRRPLLAARDQAQLKQS